MFKGMSKAALKAIAPKLTAVADAGAVSPANGVVAGLSFTAGGATGPEVAALRDQVENLRDTVDAQRTTINTILARLRTAGILAT